MDNSIGLVAVYLYRLICGDSLEPDRQQALEDYFQRFASFPAGSIGGGMAEQWLSQYRQLPEVAALRSQWRQAFIGSPPADVQGEAFIRAFLQLASQLRGAGGSDRGLYCGETVTEHNSVLDYVSGHRGQSAGQGQWIIHLTTEGQCLLSGDQQRLLDSGQLLLLPPAYDCDYQRAPGCERWVHRWLRFSPPPDWLAWSPALRRPDQLSILALDGAAAARVQGLFSELLALSSRSDEIAGRMMQNCAEYLLLLLADDGDEKDENCAALNQGLDQRVQQAVAYMLAHFAEDFSVEQLASHCHLSTARLAALFKQQLGLSPMQWRDQLRIREARRLLLTTAKSVAQVAVAVGYSDPLHFSRRFRQLLDLSPSQYRQQRT